MPTQPSPAFWLFKSEPHTWSWQQQWAAGSKGTFWDGVRNFQANNHMKTMRVGDRGFFYHSGKERAIVGTVAVIKPHYPDGSDASGRFGMVDVAALEAAPRAVTLAQIKAESSLSDMVLVKQSRLSVQPVRAAEWRTICALAGLKPDA